VVKHVAYDVKVKGTNDERRKSGRESFVNLKCTIIRLNQSVFPGVSLSLSLRKALLHAAFRDFKRFYLNSLFSSYRRPRRASPRLVSSLPSSPLFSSTTSCRCLISRSKPRFRKGSETTIFRREEFGCYCPTPSWLNPRRRSARPTSSIGPLQGTREWAKPPLLLLSSTRNRASQHQPKRRPRTQSPPLPSSRLFLSFLFSLTSSPVCALSEQNFRA